MTGWPAAPARRTERAAHGRRGCGHRGRPA